MDIMIVVVVEAVIDGLLVRNPHLPMSARADSWAQLPWLTINVRSYSLRGTGFLRSTHYGERANYH